MNFILRSVIMFGFDFSKLQFSHEYDRVNLMSEFVIIGPHVRTAVRDLFHLFDKI
jgi:hypothetical protein